MEESIMIEKARPALDSLSRLAPKLNKATDLYMNELREIEAALSKLNLGIAAELGTWINRTNTATEWDDDGEPVGDFYTAYRIGYGNDCGNWRLIVREFKVTAEYELEPVEKDVTPLMQASRDLRIAAAELIPDLLKEIEKRVKEKIEILAKVTDEPLELKVILHNGKPIG